MWVHVALLSPLLGVPQGQNQGFGRAMFLLGGSGDESSSKLFDIGWIQFFTVVGLRSSLPCWLLAGGCPPSPHAFHVGFSNGGQVPLMLPIFLLTSTTSLLTPAGESSVLLRAHVIRLGAPG